MWSSFIALTLLALAASKPLPSERHVVHERREVSSGAWVKRDEVPSDLLLPMRIGLKQTNLARGHDLLMDISWHDSPNYGKHYTVEEVNDLFAPDLDTVQSVREWVVAAGIDPSRISQSANQAWLQFDASTEEAEALLKTKYHYYEHVESGDANIACDEYHVPDRVRKHIDYITPGIKLLTNGHGGNSAGQSAMRKRGFSPSSGSPDSPRFKPLPVGLGFAGSSDLSKCGQTVTPACIAAMYNISQGNLSHPDNKLGIYEWGDIFSQKDLTQFFNTYYTKIPSDTAPDVNSVDGGVAPVEKTDDNYVGGESNLDLQVAYPIIWPQGAVIYQVDDPYYTGFHPAPNLYGLFNNFLDAIDGSYCTYSAFGETGNNPGEDYSYPDSNPGGYTGQLQCGVYKPNNVISISYGIVEYDIPASYQQRQCNEYMKLGLQGISVVFASGDSGVAGRSVVRQHKNNCLGANGTVFNPDYPSGCPYVTVVGATRLPQGADPALDEEVAATFGSGGGFSNIYARPDYQEAAVSDYLTKYAPAEVMEYPYYNTTQNRTVGAGGGIYNRIGRAYPDVSAVGENIVTVIEGNAALEYGTSASAPIFAAILTRINEERLAAGKNTVGFINPTIYAHPDAFHDITSGMNAGCGTDGFVASKGWDPVTGLGTPKYQKLLELFMSLS